MYLNGGAVKHYDAPCIAATNHSASNLRNYPRGQDAPPLGPEDFAEAASVAHVTVRRPEAKPGPLVADRSTIAKLRSALESAGIVFVEENGRGKDKGAEKGA